MRLIEMTRGETLRPLQQAVGGLIEHVGIESGEVSFWANEESKMQRDWPERVNQVATELLCRLDPRWLGWDVLVGTVVLTGGDDGDGGSRTVPDFLLKEFGLAGSLQ